LKEFYKKDFRALKGHSSSSSCSFDHLDFSNSNSNKMPSASGIERPDSFDIITDLLLEARHLISRERMTDDNNLLQIQQIIEAAQRELRRLRLRSEVERLFTVDEAVDIGVDGIESDDSGGRASRSSSEDAGGLSPEDASGGVISTMARTRQIFITRSGQTQGPDAETRGEAVATNESPTEFDLSSLRDRTDWTPAAQQELRQHTPGHEATGPPAEFSSQVNQIQRELHQINGHAQLSDDVAVAGLDSVVDELAFAASPDGQEGATRGARQEVANNAAVSSVERPGQSSLFMISSGLRRESSFVDFTDRRLGRATPSRLPDPGNVRDELPSGGESWVIRPRPSTQEERSATASDEDPSLGSDEDLSGITPLPTPPQSPSASLRREATSLNSSTAAIVGSEVEGEEAREQPLNEKQSPFTKETRAQLMAEMNADIARYSQQREWAFYREHGNGALLRAEPPEPVHEPGNEERNPSGPAGIREESLNRQELLSEVLLVDADGRHLEVDLEEVLNPAELLQPLELLVHEEDFLVYVLEKIIREDGIQWTTQLEQFVERRVPSDRARLRYQLVELGPVSGDRDRDLLTYRRLSSLLGLDRIEAISIARAIRHGENVDHIGGSHFTPLGNIMEFAVGDGMNIRQAVAFLTEWFYWLEHTDEIWNTPAEFVDIQVLQFWVALRRGWGRWQPSQEMLNRIRQVLQLESRIIHPLNTGEPGFDDSDDENSLSSIRARGLPPEEQDRFRRLREVDRLHHGRIEAIYVNWRLYMSNVRDYVWSEEVSQTPEFRHNRLERFIREERVINALRSPSN
jgi:hypothetical protein